MYPIKKTLSLLAFVLALTACQKPIEQAQFYIFGTLVDITLSDIEKDRAQEVFAEVQHDLQQMHNDWHPWEPGMLVDINRAFTQGRCAAFDPQLKYLIEASQDMEQLTGGSFNAGIGGLIDLWGFHTSEYPILAPPPASDEISVLTAQRPSTQSIYFEADTVCSSNPATQLDFGGIAKGYAVDLIVGKLQRMGVDAAIVNAGGDLRAYSNPDHQYWRIAVRHPQQGLIGLIEVDQDEAVFTSGNYQRYVEYEGQRYAHILDPKSGWPVADVVSVTVLGNNGLRADAAATALMVAGMDGWFQLSKTLQLDAVLVVDEYGKLYMTPAMQARLILYEPEDDGEDGEAADAVPEQNSDKAEESFWDIEIVE